MKVITIFFPAIISLHILIKRRNMPLETFAIIKTYCLLALLQNFLTWLVVDYGFGILVNEDAFTSMQFAIKYLSIAVIISVVLPYVLELVSKYFDVHIEIEEATNEKK